MTPDHDLNTCKRCDLTVWSVGYCDKDCQKKGWKKGGHKQECGGKGDGTSGGGSKVVGEQPQQPSHDEAGKDCDIACRDHTTDAAGLSVGCDDGKEEGPLESVVGDRGDGEEIGMSSVRDSGAGSGQDSGGCVGGAGAKQRKKKETGGHVNR